MPDDVQTDNTPKPEQPAPERETPPDKNGGNEETLTLTVKDLEKRITDAVQARLGREKKKREEDEQRIREEAEAEGLAKNQEYKELSERLQGKVKELEPYKERTERAEAVLQTYLEKEREGLPDYLLALLDEKDPATQLEYIAANREKFAPQEQSPTGTVPGTPRGSNGHNLPTDAEEGLTRTVTGIVTGRGVRR